MKEALKRWLGIEFLRKIVWEHYGKLLNEYATKEDLERHKEAMAQKYNRALIKSLIQKVLKEQEESNKLK